MKEKKKALILAAGDGTRMRSFIGENSKVLSPLLGVPIIERIILSAKEAGIEEFFVVTGYKGDQVRKKIGDGSRFNLKIKYIKNSDWEKGNGMSALSAKGVLDKPFVLLMGDHIFEPDTLKALLSSNRRVDSESVLVVDSPKNTIGLEEATKVKVEDGKVVAMGKNLEDFNGVDTGMFLCSPTLFDALKKVRKENRTLTDGMKILIKNGKLKSFKIRNRFWIDIDTPLDFKKAKEALLGNLNRRKSDGLISRSINRRLSLPISKLLVKTGLTPTKITILSFSMAVFSSYLFTLGGDIERISAGFLAQLASIVDGCDGEIARLKFKKTLFGAWLDTVLDRYADSFLIFGILLGNIKLFGLNTGFMAISFAAILGTFLTSYSAKEFQLRFRRKTPRLPIPLSSSRDVRIFLIFIGAIFNQLFLALLIITILTNLNVWQRFWVVKRSISL